MRVRIPTRSYGKKQIPDFAALTTAHFDQLRKQYSASGGVLTALSILEHEQKGVQPEGHFKFACNDKPQTLVYAVRDNCPRIFDPFCDNLEHMATSARHFVPNEIVLPEYFISECYDLKKLIHTIRIKYLKDAPAAPAHAFIAGPFMYGISSVYGALAQAQNNPELVRNITHAAACFRFTKEATLLQLQSSENDN